MSKYSLIRASMILSLSLLFVVSANARTIRISNVEQLYEAVNNAANAGATVKLSAGTYSLTAADPGGTPRPSGGRIELQENMSLIGVLFDRDSAVIDATALPASSYAGGGPPLTGAVRVGRGRNSISWLTIQNATVGSAGIETDLVWPGMAMVKIAHIRLRGHIRGLDIRNFGAAAAGESIDAELIDNDFDDNTFGLSEGLRIGNFQGANGSSVRVTMLGNRASGNEVGRLIVNNRTIGSTIAVVSIANRFRGNGAGTTVVGGLSSNATPSNNNSIELEALGDEFVDNTSEAAFDRGGLVVVGGENTSIPNGVNGNLVKVKLLACRLSGNFNADLVGIGARSLPATVGVPGNNNSVTIDARLSSISNATVFIANSQPDVPGSGNLAKLLRSRW
jgi:hypothetical protein